MNEQHLTCRKCNQVPGTLYFIKDLLSCLGCLPLDWTHGSHAWRIINRSIATAGTTPDEIDDFVEKMRQREAKKSQPAEAKPKRKRRIFKRPAAYMNAVKVFAEGNILKLSEVLQRLSDTSARTVKNYVKEAVGAGELMKIGPGLYQRPLKVQKS